jgi:hypothetical protein
MGAFRIELLHRSDEHREQRHDLYAPDIAAAVVQAKALFRAISPDNPSLVSFRIIENGLIAYEARKGDLGWCPQPHQADDREVVRAPDRRVLKRAENHSHALALYFVFYNFVRIHRTFGLVWRRVRSAMVMEEIVASIDRRDALRAGPLRVGWMRSSKFDQRRRPRGVTLNKKIVTGLLLVGAVIFLAAIIGGVFK